MRQSFLVLLVALLLGFIVPSAPATVQAASGDYVYFPQTRHNIGFVFKRFFEANGGVDNFGLPLTELFADPKGVKMQYFERARFELLPNGQVGLSLVGSLLAAPRAAEPPFLWRAGSDSPERDFFAESGHTLGGAFRWVWQSRGGVNVFGYPISEEFYEASPADGQQYITQYFQRARLEYHPENAGKPNEVVLSALGRQLLQFDQAGLAAAAPAAEIALLGEATTGYQASIRERIHNINRATEMFNGLVVPAGAEFSFNAIGEFTEENGFVDGYAIVGGRLEKVVGGGLCQVSTTLFRAVSNAGLQIVHRQGHTHVVNFYENILGFDATVFDPEVDFRWRNDTSGPIYISASSNPDQATVTFKLWAPPTGRKVRYEGPFASNWRDPGRPVWQFDKTLPKGAVRQLVHGRRGVDVSYIRNVTDANGRLIRRDDYRTKYDPWEDFYIYGPGVTPPKGVTVIPPK